MMDARLADSVKESEVIPRKQDSSCQRFTEAPRCGRSTKTSNVVPCPSRFPIRLKLEIEPRKRLSYSYSLSRVTLARAWRQITS
jgi:hypothetical protein